MTMNWLEGAHILVLEDEPLLSAVVESSLSLAGCRIVGPVKNIAGALRLIDTKVIDAAVLDLVIDGVHCDAVATALLAHNIPFVVTTGLGPIKGHAALTAAPRMTKPFHAGHLREIVASLLAEKRQPSAGMVATDEEQIS